MGDRGRLGGLSVEQRRFSFGLGSEAAEGHGAAGIAPGRVALVLALVTGSAALERDGLVTLHAVAPKVMATRAEGRRKNANTKTV